MTGAPTRPRIAILVHSLARGSVGAVACHHARELCAGFDVVVLSRDEPAAVTPGITHRRVNHRSWNWLRRFGHVPNEISFLGAARRMLEAEPPHILWCHSHAAAALVGAPLRRRSGTRVVMTTHGDIFDRPQGTYSRDLTWFYRRVTPRAYRESDAVHVLSPYMAQVARERGVAEARLHVIPNGIEPADLGLDHIESRRADTFIPSGCMRLLFVGSLWNLKGIDRLLQAFATVASSHDAGKWSLDIVGEGPQEGALRALASDLGLDGIVRFHGAAPRSRLAAFYANADALCLPSLSEAFPTVALEAMMMGLPVIGSNTGGIPALVQPGTNGWLVSPGDALALAVALRDAGSDAARLHAYGNSAAQRVAREFTWPSIGGRLRQLAAACLEGTFRAGNAA